MILTNLSNTIKKLREKILFHKHFNNLLVFLLQSTFSTCSHAWRVGLIVMQNRAYSMARNEGHH